jgi:hypothetical protein
MKKDLGTKVAIVVITVVTFMLIVTLLITHPVI